MAKPYVKQTWAKGIDAKGRPIVLPDIAPTEAGRVLWPGTDGGMNWFSPSYSPKTGLLYVPAREKSEIYFKTVAVYKPGMSFGGGGGRTTRTIRDLELSSAWSPRPETSSGHIR